MKSLKIIALSTSLSFSLGLFGYGFAQDKGTSGTVPSNKVATSTDMTEAEVRKIDKESGKITLKHGEIKNLDMPGMTMVFQVKDPAMLGTVQAGDKVKFRAEKVGGAYVVTEMQMNK